MQTFKVFGMMTGLTVLLVAFGSYFGGANGAVLFFVLAAVMNFGMYWFSDRAVLRMYRARTIGPEDAPDLYHMIDRLRQKAGLPMPTVAVAPSEQPNAFATGRSPEHAVVCVTVGILRLLPPRELEGVLAHELAHVRHRHMLVGTMAATLAGAVAMLGSVARWGMILGGFGGRNDRDGGGLGILLMAIVAPIAAMIVCSTLMCGTISPPILLNLLKRSVIRIKPSLSMVAISPVIYQPSFSTARVFSGCPK